MIKKTLLFKVAYPWNRAIIWDISSNDLREKSYVDLFNILDREFRAYEVGDSVTWALLSMARAGNPEECEALLVYRRNRGGEFFEEIEVKDSGSGVPVFVRPEDRIHITFCDPEATSEKNLPEEDAK